MTTDEELRELGKELSWDRPDGARREAVRSKVLLAADDLAPVRSRRNLAIGGAFAAGALAASVIAVIVVRRSGEPAARRAGPQISASSAAELEHTVTTTSTGVDDVIRVHAGSVRVEVPATRPDDRIRVVTRDAEVEGAGDYTVVVAGDSLTSVAVHTGATSVTVSGHPRPVFLAAGETWHAASTTAEVATGDRSITASEPAAAASAPVTSTLPERPSPVAPRHEAPPSRAPVAPTPPERVPSVDPRHGAPPSHAPVAPAPPERVPSEASRHEAAPPLATVDPSITADQASVTARDQLPATARDQPSATERHFQAGWTLLRGNRPREAALELGAAADAGGTDPLAADARYFQAVALVKAGQGAGAERALIAFLDHAPRSIRRGRAAVMLGRLLAGRGDVETARAWFDSALADPDPDVAAAARAGLSGLAARPDRAP